MFQNATNLFFWIPVIAILSLAISWLYYFWRKDQNTYSTSIKWLLFALRSAALFVIGILLLGLIFPRKQTRTEPANIFFLIDQSSSMLNYADSTQVKQEIPKFIDAAKEKLDSKYVTRFVHFSSIIHKDDTLRFDGASSNLAQGFSHIRDLFINSNLGAIVLLSDGNFNEGLHPKYEAEKIKFTPVYTLAVGDTITKRDAMISNIVANNIAFSGNIFPIKVEGKASKMNGENIVIRLSKGGNVIQEKALTLNGNNAFFDHTFEVEAKGKGIQSYTVEIVSKVQEYTLSNNKRSVYVEILESKRRAALVFGGMHPDAGAIQSILQKDQNTDVTPYFLSDLHKLPETDILILVDIDLAQNPALYKELQNSQTPYVLFVHPNMSTANLEVGLVGHSPGRSDYVGAQFNEEFSLIQFSETLKQRVKEFPPVAAPFAREMKDVGQTLLFQKVGNIATTKPLMSFTSRGNQKMVYFYGEGIWRWRMMEFNRHQNNQGFEELWDKTLQYLSVKENRDKLRVFPPSRMTVKDELRFRAEFYNDAFQEIVTPQIRLTLRDEKDKVVGNYTFSPLTRDYELNIGKMPAGIYKWEANTEFNGKKYQKNGEFIVEDISLEAQDLSANFDVLIDLSENSNGQFFLLNDWQKLLDELSNSENLSSAQFEETNYANLIDLKWLFFLIFLFLAAEWVLRRWFGGY
jgi:hypothetical protein